MSIVNNCSNEINYKYYTDLPPLIPPRLINLLQMNDLNDRDEGWIITRCTHVVEGGDGVWCE